MLCAVKVTVCVVGVAGKVMTHSYEVRGTRTVQLCPPTGAMTKLRESANSVLTTIVKVGFCKLTLIVVGIVETKIGNVETKIVCEKVIGD